ncbi:hypothetical protein SANTM175S_07050 [Streptomyces antimycoticus]
MPRTSNARTDMEFMNVSIPLGTRPASESGGRRSVAGEAEQMSSVVDPFVHTLAGDDGGGALLGADEIQEDGAA